MMRVYACRSGSKENDLLIRAIPITLWGRNLTDEQTVGLAMIETHLATTKDDLSIHCQACYVIALNYLLQNPT